MATQRSITPTEPVLVVGGTGKIGRLEPAGHAPGAPVLTAMRRPPRARRRTHQGG
jgi:hypothetical protein